MKMIGRIKKVRRHIHKMVWLYVLLFPLLILAIYSIPCFKNISVNAGELLAYYGVVFGLLGSYYKYSEDRRKENREKEKKLAPAFSVELKRNPVDEGAFQLSIVSLRDSILRNIYLYDEFLCESISKEKNVIKSVGFCLSRAEHEKKQLDYNITVDNTILDEDGYPRYIQIICDDIEGNAWVCDFNKFESGEKKMYHQISAWIP